MNQKKKIFINYSSKDREIGETIRTRFIENGYEVWIDREEIKSGDSYTSKIVKSIYSIDYFITILSNNFNNSIWAPVELEYAIVREIKEKKNIVFPICIDEFCETPLLLEIKHISDFTNKNEFELSFDSLLDKIKKNEEPPKNYRPIQQKKIKDKKSLSQKKLNLFKLNPYADDPLSKFFKPINSPLSLCFIWFFFSVFITILIGYKTGTLTSPNFKYMMRYDYLNLVNMGVIGPIGICIYYKLYIHIENVIVKLVEKDIIINEIEALKIVKDFNKKYNSKYIMTVFAVVASLITNYFGLKNRQGCWSSYDGGYTALYYRIICFFNFYVLFLVTFYKCKVTIQLLLRLSKTKLNITFDDPYKCGGLRPIGELFVYNNYFLGIIILYTTIMFFFDPSTSPNILFLIFYFIGLILFITSLFWCLSGIHKQLNNAKENKISELELEYKLVGNYEKKYIEKEIKKINRIVPWPLDTKLVIKYLAPLFIPIILIILKSFYDIKLCNRPTK